jgi:hypothetical protein
MKARVLPKKIPKHKILIFRLKKKKTKIQLKFHKNFQAVRFKKNKYKRVAERKDLIN